MQREVGAGPAREISSLGLKRSVCLAAGHSMLKVEPDGAVSSLHSTRYGKLLFGRGEVESFKIQSGIIIPLRPRELAVTISPQQLVFSSRGQEQAGAAHSLVLSGERSTGYLRTSRFTNRSDAPLKLRVLTMHDPTTLNFRTDGDPGGEIGLNAFNRGDHVVMDDVGDTTGVRVVRFSPRPGAIYLSRSKQRALDVLASGELPESVAGMSGSILVLSQHDAELPPGGAFELAVESLYHESSLETLLSEQGSRPPGYRVALARPSPVFSCSSGSVGFSNAWAAAALGAAERTGDLLDRVSMGPGLSLLRPEYFEKEFLAFKALQRRDGLLPHSLAERGGVLETSHFLIHSCFHLMLGGGPRLARKWYPALRKAGLALAKASSTGLIATEPGSPDGWRRRLLSGYPTGQLSEVNVTASRALSSLSDLAGSLGKEADAAAFASSASRIRRSVDERLRDIETGSLALNLDPRGRLHTEMTADQAVALSFCADDSKLGASIAQRLTEKDFETGFGPRTVSSSSALYYSPDYGEGQLGGCWTRASLSHSILAFASHLPAVGSGQLQKVSALVSTEAERMGGIPGEFPYWFDPDRRQVRSFGSDPVAASRFVEALMVGELGLGPSAGGLRFDPPETSRLGWLLLGGFWFTGGGALFLGRSHSRPLVVSSFEKPGVRGAIVCPHAELPATSPSVAGALFWDQSSLFVCLGSTSASRLPGEVSVRLRGKPIASSLFADFAEFDQEKGEWGVAERRRLPETLDLSVELPPNSWRAYRVTRV